MKYEKYLNEINLKADKITKVSDAIWESPELAFSEYKSAKNLINLLKEEGFDVVAPAYNIPTAFTASFGKGSPIVGILGEFDALAALDQIADLPEMKANNRGSSGHGCGHNLLGTGSAAAVIAIKKYLEDTKKSGTVIYYGCPGEEGGSGKAFMAREGAFSNLDFAITWHPSEINAISKDSSLANIQVLYKFHGISAHAAGCPELGRSALDALELMNVGTNFLREHMSSDARVHYAILNTGGISPNVVQNYAEVLYLIRAPKVSDVQELFARVNKIAEGMSIATETRFEYEIIKMCANIIPNNVIEKELYNGFMDVKGPEYTEEELAYAKKFTETAEMGHGKTFQYYMDSLFQKENIEFLNVRKNSVMNDFVVPYEEIHVVKAQGGSSDVGDVSFQCPTSQITTATWAPDSGGHSWQIVAQGKSSLAHKALLYAGKVMAYTAINMLENPAIIEAAKKEFNMRISNDQYVPIPSSINPRTMDSFQS